MKILHTADWHLGKRLQTYSRLEEQREVMDEICRIAEEQNVDVVLIAGDLYDTFSPPNEAIELFYKTLHRLANGGKRAVVGIAGNHDSPDRINAPDPLARACGIILCGRPLCEVKDCKMSSGMEVLRAEPGFVELRIPGYDYPLRLLLTPYANEATLRQYLGEEEREEELRRLLHEHWQHLADTYCDDKGVNMLMTHLFVTDEHNPQTEDEGDGERPILHMGGAQAIYTQNMPRQLQYAALGHLHRYQVVSKEPCPVVYSSSPLAYSFSEAHQPKFVVLLEAEPGKAVKMKPLRLESGRSLARKRFEELDEAISWLQENPHTFVEITLVCDKYLDAKTRKALFKAHDGIVNIIPEARKLENSEKNLDSQVSNRQQDMTDLFKNYFKSRKGQEPSESIMALFKEVLQDGE